MKQLLKVGLTSRILSFLTLTFITYGWGHGAWANTSCRDDKDCVQNARCFPNRAYSNESSCRFIEISGTCKTNLDCQDGYACIYDGAYSTTSSCRLISVGQSCHSSADCNSGFACYPDRAYSDSGTCLLVGPGQH